MTAPLDPIPGCTCGHLGRTHNIIGDPPVVGAPCYAAGCECPGYLIDADAPPSASEVLALDCALDRIPPFDPAMVSDGYIVACLAAWRDEGRATP